MAGHPLADSTPTYFHYYCYYCNYLQALYDCCYECDDCCVVDDDGDCDDDDDEIERAEAIASWSVA